MRNNYPAKKEKARVQIRRQDAFTGLFGTSAEENIDKKNKVIFIQLVVIKLI